MERIEQKKSSIFQLCSRIGEENFRLMAKADEDLMVFSPLSSLQLLSAPEYSK